MSDFYNYLHGDEQMPSQRASRELPIQRSQMRADQMYNSALNNIEQVKQQLYEKIDVCCAQYGLYGLKIIDKAIADSLRIMINGANQQPQMMPQPATYQQPQQYSIPEQYVPQQPQPQQPMSRDEMMTNAFVANLDTILAECDKDADKRAEEQMKQRLYEQKQTDILLARNAEEMRNNAKVDLSQHENDFVIESEQDLRPYV